MPPSPPAVARADNRIVAIIGGGAAGTLAALHLFRASGGHLRPRVIEPRAALGEGIAYSTRDPRHLLNVRAGNLAAFADDPGGFVGHVAAHAGPSATQEPLAQRYLPRRDYAGYLRATLDGLAGGDDVHLQDEAVDVEAADDGFVVRLRSGQHLAARAVVLATGNTPRRPVASVAGVVSGWDYDAVAALDPGRDVAIIGSGLSMVDAVLTLSAGGHRGRIDVLSRHGLLPLPHHGTGGAAGDVDALLPLGVRARMRALRDVAAARARDGQPWQWTMDQLRPHGRALWQSLPNAEQERFLRHAVRYWDIHRHRVAPDVAVALDALLARGQLRVHAGRVRAVETTQTGLALRYLPRGSDTETVLHAAALVDCTGIEARIQAIPGTLLATLAARGVVRPGAHGLGVEVDADGAVVSAAGHVIPGLLAIGTPRLGAEWETTAIPELRLQAEALARRLTGAG